jgi:hypothetical protein
MVEGSPFGPARWPSFGHGDWYVRANRYLYVMKVWCKEPKLCVYFPMQSHMPQGLQICSDTFAT